MKEVLESTVYAILFGLVAFLIGVVVGGKMISGGVKDDCRLMKQYRIGDRFLMTCEVTKDDK